MQQERYEEICKQLSPSMESMLKLIRRYVLANQASVMVGAGFSKNADMNPGVQMKEWNELGVEFYKQLYAKENPGKEEFFFKSPIRLASQYASFTTHAELDKVISDSLPDNAISPGALHKRLMRLPWRDVFTTNYDTLLERTKPSWKQNYTIVTNRESLIYSTSPRIIKLHGSFPNQHPFIMTEEDFRTYPSEHPEFVNTVRQSLIENLFCLIGFSGDDENFLSWLGWLRDVIGKESVMCYMITYNKNLHDSEVSLLQSRGITPVNLHRLPLNKDEGYADALEFFLTYITPEDKPEDKEWDGKLDEGIYEDLVHATEEMRTIRESYPDWPFLPAERLNDFKDLEQRAPYIKAQFDALKDEEKVLFVRELLWRIWVSYSSMDYDWLIEYMQSVIENEDIHKTEITDMALMLLLHYRITGKFDEIEKITEKLNSIEEYGSTMQIHIYAYELGLSYASTLDLQNLKKVLHAWDVPQEDIIPTLWKANLLTFAGEIDSAKVHLQAAIQHIDNQSRTSYTTHLKMLKDALQMSLYAVDYRGGNIPRPEKSLYMSYTERLKMDLINYEKNGRAGQEVVHTYNVGRKLRKWHSGIIGMKGDYIYPYRYLMMRDRMGYPMGTNDYGIDIVNLESFLSVFAKYEPTYATSCAVRSKKDEVIKSVFTRELLQTWKSEHCEGIYKSEYGRIFRNPKSQTEERLRSDVLIPLFSRMCTRFSQGIIIEVFEVLLTYCSKQARYDKLQEYFSIIYDCAEEETKGYILHKCMMSPMAHMSYADVPMPVCFLPQITISDDVVNFLVDALINTDADKEVVIRRILKLWKWLNDEQKSLVQNVIYNWRGVNRNSLAIETYRTIMPTALEQAYIHDVNEQLLELLSQCTWNNEASADAKDRVINIMNSIDYLLQYLTFDQLKKLYSSITSLVPKVYDRNMSAELTPLNNDYFYYFHFDKYFKDIIRQTAEQMWGTNEATQLIRTLVFIDHRRMRFFELRLRLQTPNELPDIKKLASNVNRRIISRSRETKDDAIMALRYCGSRSINILNSLTPMFSYMKIAQDESLTDDLQYCAEILKTIYDSKFLKSCSSTMENVFELFENSELSSDFRADISFYLGRLAGMMSEIDADVKTQGVVAKWLKRFDNDETDADIRNSFKQGKLIYIYG